MTQSFLTDRSAGKQCRLLKEQSDQGQNRNDPQLSAGKQCRLLKEQSDQGLQHNDSNLSDRQVCGQTV